ARSSVAAVAAPDGRIYAIGGLRLDSSITPAVEAYTPERDRWVAIAPLDVPRAAGGAAVDSTGRILMCGGIQPMGVFLSSVAAYGPNVILSPSQAAPGQPVAVDGENFAARAAVAVTIDGAYVAGGKTNNLGELGTSFVVPPLASGAHRVITVD